MCSVVVIFSLVDYFTSFKITSRWIVEPLGFAYGIIAAKYSASIRRWLNKKWIAKTIILMVVSGLLGLSYLKFKPVVFWGDYLLKLILGIAITAFIFEGIAKLKVGNKANSFLGGISYEVYILHHGVFALLIALSGGDMNSGVFICGAVLITILAACLLEKICSPMIKGINKIGG